MHRNTTKTKTFSFNTVILLCSSPYLFTTKHSTGRTVNVTTLRALILNRIQHLTPHAFREIPAVPQGAQATTGALRIDSARVLSEDTQEWSTALARAV